MPGDAYFASTSLLLNLNGFTGSTTVLDYSPSPKVITFVGNAQLSQAQSKYGGSSLLLDGTGDYIQTVTNLSDFRFGTGDFTLEAWVRTSTGNKVLFDFYGSTQLNSYQLFIDGSGNLQWWYSNGTTGLNALSTTGAFVTTGSWVHVAVSRVSGVLRIFIGGVKRGEVADVRDYNNVTVTPFAIGAQVYTRNASYDFNGHIDDARVTKGVGRYVADFTPPAEELPRYAVEVTGVNRDSVGALVSRVNRIYRRDTGALLTQVTSGDGNVTPGDNFGDYRVLLLNFNTPGTVFTDASPKQRGNATVNGNAIITAAQSKYGGASGYFDGTGDWIQFADSEDWHPGTGDYTWSCWARPDNTTNANVGRLFGQCSSGGGTAPAIMQQNAAGTWGFSIYNGAAYQGITSTAPSTAGVWAHLAATKVGTLITFYVNGVSQGSFTIGNGGNLANSTDVFSVGRMGAFADQYYRGYIDDLELVKGAALWTADFTPPYHQREMLSYSVGEMGVYKVRVTHGGELQRVVLDDAVSAPFRNDLIDRVVA